MIYINYMSDQCIFCKIVDKKLPAEIVYEDENILAFNDINPKAEKHVLLIPKKHIESLQYTEDLDRDILGELLLSSKKIMKSLGVESGYRTIVNTGKGGGQEVFHLHLHLLAGNLPNF